MKNRVICVMIASLISVHLCSCALFTKGMDDRSSFSKTLSEVEDGIRNEEWDKARIGQDKAFKTWHQLKPFLQIDIDHDYVYQIEKDFISLRAYLEMQDKSEALVTIMLIEDVWENIGEM